MRPRPLPATRAGAPRRLTPSTPAASRIRRARRRRSNRIDRQRHELFWSLNFAVRRADVAAARRVRFRLLRLRRRGHRPRAARAQRLGIPLLWVAGALVYHQWHPPTRLDPSRTPEIVANARRFRAALGSLADARLAPGARRRRRRHVRPARATCSRSAAGERSHRRSLVGPGRARCRPRTARRSRAPPAPRSPGTTTSPHAGQHRRAMPAHATGTSPTGCSAAPSRRRPTRSSTRVDRTGGRHIVTLHDVPARRRHDPRRTPGRRLPAGRRTVRRRRRGQPSRAPAPRRGGCRAGGDGHPARRHDARDGDGAGARRAGATSRRPPGRRARVHLPGQGPRRRPVGVRRAAAGRHRRRARAAERRARGPRGRVARARPPIITGGSRVTGFLTDGDLAAAVDAADVPIVPARDVSASASLAAWLAGGRRPLVAANAYSDELVALDARPRRPVPAARAGGGAAPSPRRPCGDATVGPRPAVAPPRGRRRGPPRPVPDGGADDRRRTRPSNTAGTSGCPTTGGTSSPTASARTAPRPRRRRRAVLRAAGVAAADVRRARRARPRAATTWSSPTTAPPARRPPPPPTGYPLRDHARAPGRPGLSPGRRPQPRRGSATDAEVIVCLDADTVPAVGTVERLAAWPTPDPRRPRRRPPRPRRPDRAGRPPTRSAGSPVAARRRPHGRDPGVAGRRLPADPRPARRRRSQLPLRHLGRHVVQPAAVGRPRRVRRAPATSTAATTGSSPTGRSTTAPCSSTTRRPSPGTTSRTGPNGTAAPTRTTRTTRRCGWPRSSPNR